MKKKALVVGIGTVAIALLALFVVFALPKALNGSSKSPGQVQQPAQPKNTQPLCYVEFWDFDGSIIETTAVAVGESILPPTAPKHDGYVFLRWDKSTQDIHSDMVIRAIYQTTMVPTISVDHLYISKDAETATVQISIWNNPGVAAMLFDLDYGKGLVLQAVEFSDDFGEYATAPEPFSNPQRFNMVSPFAEVDSNGAFITLTFAIDNKKLADNESRVELNIVLNQDNTFDTDYHEIPFKVFNGSITIIEDN